MKKKYLVYGLNIAIEVSSSNTGIIKGITEQFQYYPKGTNDKEDIRIQICEAEEQAKEIRSNPSIHGLIENGFITKYSKFNISYVKKDDTLDIKVNLKSEGNVLLRYLKKLNNIQYSNINERAVQIIWEHCLYTYGYFNPNYSPLHSSGFAINNTGLLLGGTGGVGKTSLELILSDFKEFKFMNDDIAIVGKNGFLFPNLSWPKIYAYNLYNNNRLKKLFYQNRSIDDKIAFRIKKYFWGDSKARRIINPKTLFSQVEVKPVPLKNFILLSKGDYKKTELKQINYEEMISLNLAIIKSEFFEFERHLNWHSLNSYLAGKVPIIELDDVHQKWKENQNNIFKNVNCYVLEIPKSCTHKDFLTKTSTIIRDLFR